MKKKTLYFLLISMLISKNAFACLSCGCSGSGSSGDMDSLGGISNVFAKGNNFLFQIGSSFRDINGSFNELGKWNPSPTDSRLQTSTSSLKLMYFANQNLGFSIQTPIVGNLLNKANWGDFGSINPTDTDFLTGLSFGDLSTQVNYKVLELDNMAFSPWLNVSFPTGVSKGKSENFSGNGTYSTSLGLSFISKINRLELFSNIGYQHPFTEKDENKPYSIGQSFFYQLGVNYNLTHSFITGLSLSGMNGAWVSKDNKNSIFILKISPSFQYNFDYDKGVKVSLSYTPLLYGLNTLTDTTINFTYYNFIK